MQHVILGSGWIERLPVLLGGSPAQIPVAYVPTAAEAGEGLIGMGFPVTPLPLAELTRAEVERRLAGAGVVFVTEALPDHAVRSGFADAVPPLVRSGALTYVGIGAGATLAGPAALGLVPVVPPLTDQRVIDVWDDEWRVLSAAAGPLSLDDVARLALELPEVTETERRGCADWAVGGKGFAWERPFSKADLKRFGAMPPPDGPIVAVRVGDLHEKEAVLAAKQPGVFTIPHFNGYAAVLIQLNATDPETLRELLTDAWRAKAPPGLAR